ncbi:MAG: YecA family protein [Burkholderiaceae bacterium]
MPGPQSRPSARPSRPVARGAASRPQPLSDRELDELQALLDRVPEPLEPLDVSMLDGFLCGVLLQPRPVASARWLPCITDVDARALPKHFDASRLHALALRRHRELNDAISRRQWFDPWVFELTDDPGATGAVSDDADADDDASPPAPIDAVYPWVAGFATALETFPGLMALDAKLLTEPLALVYRHLASDDLEDADELLAEIESLEPPEDLAEAVEGLVRTTLLLADIARPVSAASNR